MPFLIYEIEQKSRDTLVFTKKREAKLAGNKSPAPLYQHVQNLLKKSPSPEKTLRWEIDERQLLGFLGVPENHALLIDLKPRADGNRSLYRLNHVWGFSKRLWTPLALKLETLFVDETVKSPAEKERFEFSRLAKPAFVYEFLYVGGGIEGGSWNRGMVGRVNGALLWPDVAKYFMTQILSDIQANTEQI